MKPFSESCVQNREPILQILRQELSGTEKILEIGSGSGQHAVYFAEKFPSATWQTSDVAENHPGIKMWLNDARLVNVANPLQLDVTQETWPNRKFDVTFSANTVHIMPWTAVQVLFKGVANTLVSGGKFLLYGPFNYKGAYTSPSNADFDIWLKNRDPRSGIRDFEALNELAMQAGLILTKDYEMPANNRILVWQSESS